MGSEKVIPQYDAMINLQEENGGIQLEEQEVGTRIIVETKNSTYNLTIVDPKEKKIKVQGGKFWEEPATVYFCGSTWGGSMLKMGWIGFGMHMEFGHHEKPGVISTSAVKKATIIGEGWEYSFDWSSD
ncbi:MAG: hypothetical protein ACW99G_00305 [Candidatus Thorarchaeota archaeon]|jgi:hypothetical protein